jgi:PHD/YefM family antitoxin component YafN of YafNO toxin-antitoxin module
VLRPLVEIDSFEQHGIQCEFHATEGTFVIHLDDIYSLSHFQRNAKAFVRRLKSSRKPAVLTVNGRAEVVVQDAASYQALLDRLDRVETIVAVRESLETPAKGKGRPAEVVLEELRRRHKIPRGA